MFEIVDILSILSYGYSIDLKNIFYFFAVLETCLFSTNPFPPFTHVFTVNRIPCDYFNRVNIFKLGKI